MRFGIITPVFDGCLESLELLFGDLQAQTYNDWIWMMCSNGYSEKIAHFVKQKNRSINAQHDNIAMKILHTLWPRIVYINTPYKILPDAYSLLANIGERRNECIRRINADYLFMIDADAKLLDHCMFNFIASQLTKTPKDLCIYKILHEIGMLPVFPIGYARIDMLNYCVKSSVARKVGYPTGVTDRDRPGNDYWFFDRIYKETQGEYLFIDRVFGQHNGNNTYINLLKLL